jgi:GNAT superfamily N-acetyltransferase
VKLSEAEIRQMQRHCIGAFELWYESTANLGTRVDHVLDAAVFQWPDLPLPLFNRALGLGDEQLPDVAAIDRIVDIYQKLDVRAFVQLSPLSDQQAIGQMLEGRDLVRDGSMATLVLRSDHWEGGAFLTDPAIQIEPVDHDNADDFCQVVLQAFAITRDFEPFLRTTMALPHMRNFLARYDGEPAGVGQIASVAGVAGLYSGGVIARFRGRGIQSALIDHRIRTAIDQGMEILYSGTEEPDNQSSRNLRKQGFFIAYELENWAIPA